MNEIARTLADAFDPNRTVAERIATIDAALPVPEGFVPSCATVGKLIRYGAAGRRFSGRSAGDRPK